MLEAIIAQPQWFWISLGGVLLIAEMLGAGGYLLWSGTSAVLVGALVWMLPMMSWEMQGIIFTLLTVAVVILWWRWLRSRPKAVPSGLNQRGNQMIGTRAVLTEPMHSGYGRITVGDGSWRMHAAEDLPVGTEVEVVAIDGITLQVRPVAPHP